MFTILCMRSNYCCCCCCPLELGLFPNILNFVHGAVTHSTDMNQTRRHDYRVSIRMAVVFSSCVDGSYLPGVGLGSNLFYGTETIEKVFMTGY